MARKRKAIVLELQRFAIVVLGLCTAGTAVSQTDPKGCSGREGSTMHEACELGKTTMAAEMRLERLIEERLKYSEAASDLRESQAAWLKFRAATCEWQQAELGGINSINFARCIGQLTSERARYFEELP